MSTSIISGEQSNTKFLAVFATEAELDHCRVALQQDGIDPNQVVSIAPHEQNYARKLEPEPQGIERTAIRSHVLFGGLGLLIGLVIWVALYASEVEFIVASPIISLLPFVLLFPVAGMMLGGFVTLRPDHLIVIEGVKQAQSKGQWSLIVHSRNSNQKAHLEQWFKDANIHAVHSV